MPQAQADDDGRGHQVTYICRRVANVSQAEDLPSETMERALTHPTSHNERQETFSNWLFRMAHNTWITAPQEQPQIEKEIDELEAQERSPGDSIQKDKIVRMLECMNRLPFRQQEILTLHFAGQLKNKEIAQVLHMNESTVSVTLSRALRRLRQQLVEPEKDS